MRGIQAWIRPLRRLHSQLPPEVPRTPPCFYIRFLLRSLRFNAALLALLRLAIRSRISLAKSIIISTPFLS